MFETNRLLEKVYLRRVGDGGFEFFDLLFCYYQVIVSF